jgi:hypothetical protein
MAARTTGMSVPQAEVDAAHEVPLGYRLLTGSDDRAFCEKVSRALDEGYMLYGSPAIAKDADGNVTCAQAVVRRDR